MNTIIIGNSGSGKTWLAKRLSTIFTAPVVHLDDLFWEPGGFDKKRSPQEVELLIQQSKDRAPWIAEGVFGELASRYLDAAELLVWLDIEWPICKQRLVKRGSESKRHLNRDQSEEGLRKLLEWASHHYDPQDLRSYEGHRAMFEKFPGKKAYLKSETDVNRFVANAQQVGSVDSQGRAVL